MPLERKPLCHARQEQTGTLEWGIAGEPRRIDPEASDQGDDRGGTLDRLLLLLLDDDHRLLV